MRELKCTKNASVKTSKDCEVCFGVHKPFSTRALCVRLNAKYLDVIENIEEPIVVAEEPPKKRKKKK